MSTTTTIVTLIDFKEKRPWFARDWSDERIVGHFGFMPEAGALLDWEIFAFSDSVEAARQINEWVDSLGPKRVKTNITAKFVAFAHWEDAIQFKFLFGG